MDEKGVLDSERDYSFVCIKGVCSVHAKVDILWIIRSQVYPRTE